MLIRDEIGGEAATIAAVVTAAMKLLPQASGTEAAIVEGLRESDALTLSLVAEDAGEVIGYLAASEARIGDSPGWGLIGPLAVLPARHRQGVGRALMAEAILRLRANYRGAVLVGDPGYYGRFGFRPFPGLRVGDCPAEFIQALPFGDVVPQGEVIHHPAFGVAQNE